MSLGDSLTVGYAHDGLFSPGGYRDSLYSGFLKAGLSFESVGSSSENTSDALNALGQTRHEGHSGFLIAGNTTRAGLLENLPIWLSNTHPDWIILMIGTNDVATNYDLGNAPKRLEALLNEISRLDPFGRVLLSTIPNTLDSGTNVKIAAYNAAMPALADVRPFVHFFDNSGLLIYPEDYGDGLHLNSQGYQKLGNALAGELINSTPEPSGLAFCGIFLLACHAARIRICSRRN